MQENRYLWDIAHKLIEFNTVSFKSNSACSSFVANQLEDLGLKVYIEEFNDHGVIKEQVIARIGPEVEDGLIFSGHMDTVPFENQQGWSKDPLKLTLTNDKLYGRGTTDMKLFIAHCLAAFKEIDLTKLKKPIACIFTADEEVGCLGAKRLIKNVDSLKDQMPLPNKAIIGEPTSFNIINTHKGIVHFDLVFKGIAGHSSRPHQGHNALEDMGQVIELIRQMNTEFANQMDKDIQKLFPDFPYNHLHVAMAQGGQALNMIPDSARLSISYRCFPLDPPLRIFDKLKENIQKLNLKFTVEIEHLLSTPGLQASPEKKLMQLLKEITQGDVQSVSFATDAGPLSQADIACYVCGPGDLKMAHQPDEYMDLSDFLQGKDFVKKIVHSYL